MRATEIVTRNAAMLFAAVAMSSAATSAQGVLIPHCGPSVDCIPRPCVSDRACGQPWSALVTRSASNVTVKLSDGVLHYEVDETFVNNGGRIGEADYIFPLPKNAAFADLKLSINGELVGGETMDAQHARAIYEEIVRRQRDPALVEWMGYGMLRTRIFPILPREQKRVVIHFDQIAEREGDALRIDYVKGGPLTQPFIRNVSNGASATGSSFTLEYDEFGKYGTAYSPTHELRVDNHDRIRSVVATGAAPVITILVPAARASTEPAITLLASNNGIDDGFALINLVPPVAARAVAPRDITFVLDVSGSMSGRKIEQARAAGRQLLATLAPRDRFRLIDFSTDVRSFRTGFVAANSENVHAALQYLDQLSASGATNISGALSEALRYERDDSDVRRLRIVLFLTDGMPTIGEHNADAIAAQVTNTRGSARVFTFGLGADVNASLLEQLALQGRGTAQFVRPGEDVERAVSVVAGRLTNPVATDVRITADGARLSKILPGGPIDVFADQNVIVLARYSGAGPVTLHFDGSSASGPVHWAQRVNFPRSERGNEFIARLWATQRVGYLSAERRRAGPSGELDDEIRSLGVTYGIPTELTSFLVQEPATVTVAQGHEVRAGTAGRGSVVALNAAPAAAFEAARQATSLRAATTLAAADAASIPMNAANDGKAHSVVRAGSVQFALSGGVWTDVRLLGPSGEGGAANVHMARVRIQAFSPAYFRVLELVPLLQPMLALGENVIVAGRNVILEVTPAGLTSLGAHEAALVCAGW